MASIPPDEPIDVSRLMNPAALKENAARWLKKQEEVAGSRTITVNQVRCLLMVVGRSLNRWRKTYEK